MSGHPKRGLVFLMTPRPCRMCGRWMDADFLLAKHKARKKPKPRTKRILEPRFNIGKEQAERILLLRSQGVSIRKIAKVVGVAIQTVMRVKRLQSKIDGF